MRIEEVCAPTETSPAITRCRFTNHKSEIKAVKEALKKVRIEAEVRHGRVSPMVFNLYWQVYYKSPSEQRSARGCPYHPLSVRWTVCNLEDLPIRVRGDVLTFTGVLDWQAGAGSGMFLTTAVELGRNACGCEDNEVILKVAENNGCKIIDN